MTISQVLRNLVIDYLIKFQGLTYAKIIKYNKDKLTADIEFFKFKKVRTADGVKNKDFPKAFDVPIISLGAGSFVVRPTYKKNAVVAVAISASEIRADGQKTSDKSKALSKDNCIILGGLQTIDENQDTEIFIGSDDINVKLSENDIVLNTKNSKIEVTDSKIEFTSGTSKFTVDVTGATISLAGLTVNLFTHIHPTPVGPSSSPVPGT